MMHQPDDTRAEAVDVYVDSLQMTINAYTIALLFGLSPAVSPAGQIPQPRTKAVVRMSPEHAKVMALLMRRNLKQYERELGVEIPVPHQVQANLGISLEDW